jgi:hypothetical protein
MAIEFINDFVKNITGLDYPDWFNKNMSDSHLFERKKINKANFNLFWNKAIPIIWDKNTDKKINFMEFLAINTIIVNETGGTYIAKLPEGVNSVNKTEHPGIAYAFDKIPGTKKSYNTLKDVENKTAFDLFNDFHYKDQFKNLPFADTKSGLINTQNSLWAGELFPTKLFDKNTLIKAVSPQPSTFINEADFFKFRGRGYVQVTGRAIYKSLIEYILDYTGNNRTIRNYQGKWGMKPYNADPDIIATRSTNADWDDLFSNTDMEIAIRSVREHASNQVLGNGNYQYIKDLDQPADKILAKVLKVADKISGTSKSYRELYKNRILLQTDTLNKS